MSEPRSLEEWAGRASDSCDHIEMEGVCEACLVNALRTYAEQEVNKATSTLQAALDEWRTHRMADATGHMLRCAKVNQVWSCAKGCAVAERNALLAVAKATQAYLDAQEDRLKAMEAHPKDIEQPSVLAWILELRKRMLNAVAHPIVQRLMKEGDNAQV